ncbi:Rha family transcriptional regulator [Arsenophonus sp.]|uniref:Rha family transcriptional regulator n=1 Tax=Arsenophonus sp. TaxID=1872640 RepID=UPI00387A45BA
MQYSNVVVLPVSKKPTMSSLEMIDYINADRASKAKSEGLAFPCKKYRQLQHRSFLTKVPKVLGEHLAKFFAQYKDSTGRDLPCYRFPKREACLMAMSYSYELQATVFDRMTELEGGQDINLLDLSGLTELTIKQMQDRVALAEKHSFTEHGQKGSSLMALRRREKKTITIVEEQVKKLSQLLLCDLGDFPDTRNLKQDEQHRIH